MVVDRLSSHPAHVEIQTKSLFLSVFRSVKLGDDDDDVLPAVLRWFCLSAW